MVTDSTRTTDATDDLTCVVAFRDLCSGGGKFKFVNHTIFFLKCACMSWLLNLHEMTKKNGNNATLNILCNPLRQLSPPNYNLPNNSLGRNKRVGRTFLLGKKRVGKKKRFCCTIVRKAR